MYLLLRFVALLLGLAAMSCQVLADIETRTADPLPKECILPAWSPGSGLGRVRLAHLVPTTDRIDICVSVAGANSYGRPMFRSHGTDPNNICGKGLNYANVTAAFAVPTGSLDFKIIPATKTCAAAALAEAKGVSVGTDVVQTLAYMGQSGEGKGLLTAMLEASGMVMQNRNMRFVNAIQGVQLLWGGTTPEKLPAEMEQPFLNTPQGFGQLPKKGMGASSSLEIDEQGYMTFITNPLNIGGYLPGTKKMLFVGRLTGAGNVTLYAIGKNESGSPFPIRGLYCRDPEVQQTPELQVCTLTDLEDFRIDVFNAGLYGAFAKVEQLRAAQVISDLAARGKESDLLCVSEVSRHRELDIPQEQQISTQEALIDAAMNVEGGFRYFAQAHTDLDTMVDDPVDQSGNIPPPLNRAPCDSSVPEKDINIAYSCLINNCNSKPGDPTGVTSGSTDCYSAACGTNALGFLLLGDANAQQCFNCIVLNGLSYISFEKSRQRCTTDTRRPYGFSGATTSMLLSKLPLSDQDQLVLPTSAFRRTVLYAKMAHGPDGLDVYCVAAPPLLGSQIPYTGGYAPNSSNHANAWQEEQSWIMPKIIAWIQRKSAGRPAIIMGDWSSSAKALDKMGNVIPGPDGLPAVGDVNPESLRTVQSAFFEAVPDGFVPKCTRCPKSTGPVRNPYNQGVTDPMWTLRVFVKDPWTSDIAQSAGYFYDELDRVPLPDTEFAPSGPLSDTFGYRVNIRRP